MMPPARSSRESIATCSSSGARADISRAAAPGDAAGIRASVWRAAGTAFRTKPALQRKFTWPPKRRRTPTASPARPTIIRPVRFASMIREIRAHSCRVEILFASSCAGLTRASMLTGHKSRAQRGLPGQARQRMVRRDSSQSEHALEPRVQAEQGTMVTARHTFRRMLSPAEPSLLPIGADYGTRRAS
jgi:hypothetical protein